MCDITWYFMLLDKFICDVISKVLFSQLCVYQGREDQCCWLLHRGRLYTGSQEQSLHWWVATLHQLLTWDFPTCKAVKDLCKISKQWWACSFPLLALLSTSGPYVGLSEQWLCTDCGHLHEVASQAVCCTTHLQPWAWIHHSGLSSVISASFYLISICQSRN